LPESVSFHERRSGRPGLVEPAELGVHVTGAIQHDETLFRRPWTMRKPRRRIPDLLQCTSELVDFDVLEIGEAMLRPGDLNPPTVHPGHGAIQFAERIVAILRLPQVA